MMLNSIQDPLRKQRIIADIGGTNARFALLNSDGSIQDQIVLKGNDFPSFVSAFREYLRLIDNIDIKEAAVAIANPLDGDDVKMTNHSWYFSIEETRKALGLEKLVFKNDFEALAMSIPYLTPNSFHQVGGQNYKKQSPIGVLGPGTGLGVSGLIHSGQEWIPLSSEGGHVSLSPTTAREIEILNACLKQYKHVSAERLISGPGLKIIHQLICELDGVDFNTSISAHEISEQALTNSNQQSVEALAVFCGLLGVVAGNLALTLGAKGGIYIGGGIVPKLGSYFDNSPFRERFEAKGRFKDYLAKIPVYVIKAENPALTGIKQVFVD